MSIKIKIRSSRGFSLTELMVVLGFTSLLFLGAGTLTLIQMRGAESMKSTVEVNIFRGYLKQITSSEQSCQIAMGWGYVTATGLVNGGTVLTGTGGKVSVPINLNKLRPFIPTAANGAFKVDAPTATQIEYKNNQSFTNHLQLTSINLVLDNTLSNWKAVSNFDKESLPGPIIPKRWLLIPAQIKFRIDKKSNSLLPHFLKFEDDSASFWVRIQDGQTDISLDPIIPTNARIVSCINSDVSWGDLGYRTLKSDDTNSSCPRGSALVNKGDKLVCEQIGLPNAAVCGQGEVMVREVNAGLDAYVCRSFRCPAGENLRAVSSTTGVSDCCTPTCDVAETCSNTYVVPKDSADISKTCGQACVNPDGTLMSGTKNCATSGGYSTSCGQAGCTTTPM